MFLYADFVSGYNILAASLALLYILITFFVKGLICKTFFVIVSILVIQISSYDSVITSYLFNASKIFFEILLLV